MVVEPVEPDRMSASDPDELIEEIRRKSLAFSLVSMLSIVGTILLFLGLIMLSEQAWTAPLFMVLGIASYLGLPWAAWWDRRSLITRVNYDFDPLGERLHEGLTRLQIGLMRAERIWSVRLENVHGDWKRNAGAGVSVDRAIVKAGWGLPPRVSSNVRIGHLIVSGTTIYFFPDRLLIYEPNGVRSVQYTDLSIDTGTVSFIESESVPRDALKVGTTWRFVNRDGGPDLRFNNNKQLPVMEYDVLTLYSEGGLRLKLQISTKGLAAGSAAILGLVREAIQDLKSRDIPLEARTGSLTDGVDDPIPLAESAKKAAQVGVAALEYRWLAALPEWALPIFWGLAFVLPVVALIFVAARGWNPSTLTFLLASIILPGFGIPVLIRDRRKSLLERADEEAQARKEDFRDVLKQELRSKPIKFVDFDSLVEQFEISRQDADEVADDLYRRMVDRVVADGVITADERRKLQILAKTLRLTPERWSRLESQGITSRYRDEVSKVWSDGILTPEEERMLEDLRNSLGVSEDELPLEDTAPND